ncbi:MAG: hypothetical protein BGN88_06715 [Clostridiales bacterium 43-6]|nr:MAG: hypothetical protein BGN88_06715 [Clostridiales bacterium 43-6]
MFDIEYQTAIRKGMVIRMIPVFLYGKNDKSLSVHLRTALAKNGGVLHISENKFSADPIHTLAHFMLYEFEHAPVFNMDTGIIVFKKELPDHVSLSIPSGFQAIVESDNQPALALLKKLRVPAITCGMSVSDTLSISSHEENSASISLQRDVMNVINEKIEECEITVKMTEEISSYSLLAISAVLLLSDRFQNEIEI